MTLAPLLLSWSSVALLAAAPAGVEQPRRLGPAAPAQVRRVVTLAPSLTEAVIALGLTDRLVGVSRYDELPEVARLTRVGGFIDPSVEAVLALKPDLVLVQPAPGNQRPVEKMAELGAPVLALPMHSVAQVLTALREMGRALGVPQRADALAADLERRREAVRARARIGPHPKVLFVYGFEPLVVAGPGSFADELLRDAGGRNAADQADSPYPVYPVESAVRAHPDVVIDASDTGLGAEKLKDLPGLSTARWVKPPSKDLMHPGPRLGAGLEELFLLLHPDRDAGP